MNLLRFANWMMAVSTVLLIGGFSIAFGLETRLDLIWIVLSHVIGIISALGIKIGYVLRLEGLKRYRQASVG